MISLLDNMDGDEDVDLPEAYGAGDNSQDNDDAKCQIWSKDYFIT